jgi:hypothetical protein
MELWETNMRAKSTLVSTIGAGDSSLAVVTGSNPAFPTANFVITIDDEKIDITSRTGDTFTIRTRGYEGTTGAVHTSGTTVSLYSYLPPTLVDTEEKVPRVSSYT